MATTKEVKTPKAKPKAKPKTGTRKTKPPIKQFKYTPEQLLNQFILYQQKEGSKDFEKRVTGHRGEHSINTTEWVTKIMPLSIIGFSLFLKVNKSYLYDLPKEKYGDTLDLINDLLEEHINKGIASGDITASWGIFYLKNKFGYRDVKQLEADVNQTVNTKCDLTDEQLWAIINNE